MKYLVIVFIAISCTPQKANNYDSSKYADSLISFMQSRLNPYLQNLQADSVRIILDSLSSHVSDLDDYSLTCYWLLSKSVQHVVGGNLDSAAYYIHRAMDLALKKDTTKRMLLMVQVQLANVLKEQKLIDSALLNAKQAFELAKQIDTTQLPIICYRLYEIYREIDDPVAMRKYLFEGFKYSKEPMFKTAFANGITDYYENEEQIDSAFSFYKIVEKDTVLTSPYYSAIKYSNMGWLLSKKNRLTEALQYQLKGMEINKEIKQLSAWSFLNLATTYRKLKQYRNADIFLDSALHMGVKDKNFDLIKGVWQEKKTMLRAQNKYRDALAAMDSAYHYFEKEVDSSLILQARELETKYAVKEKEDAITMLAFKNETNEQITHQQRIIIAALFLVIALLFVTGILLWRRRTLHLQLRELELQQQMLRSQINPHFIYNSLSVLQGFISENEQNKSLDYLNKFSRLLRTSLEHASENFASLQDEIKALENYLSLQIVNFDGKFDYHIALDNIDEPDKVLIPSMLLQPFVENAILHGIAKVEYKGMIEVKIERKGEFLQCIVEDNGAGLQKTHPVYPIKSPLGTKITQDRLSILAKQFHKPVKLNIIDKESVNEGRGVKVEIIIPVQIR